MLAVEQVVAVLHAHDVDDLPGLGQLGDGDLRQPDPSDQALGLKLPQRAELVGERRVGIDAVQLEQFDPLDPQPARGLLDLGAQDLWPPVELPLAPGPVRATPTLVVISSPSGQGCNASASSSSLAPPPYRRTSRSPPMRKVVDVMSCLRPPLLKGQR